MNILSKILKLSCTCRLFAHLIYIPNGISDGWLFQGGRISLDKQIRNHWITILKLTLLIGRGSLVETKKYLNKCIYTVGMGSNDYINNYFVPTYYKTSSMYTPEQYAEALVKQYSRQLQVHRSFLHCEVQN